MCRGAGAGCRVFVCGGVWVLEGVVLGVWCVRWELGVFDGVEAGGVVVAGRRRGRVRWVRGLVGGLVGDMGEGCGVWDVGGVVFAVCR